MITVHNVLLQEQLGKHNTVLAALQTPTGSQIATSQANTPTVLDASKVIPTAATVPITDVDDGDSVAGDFL